jgi:phosphomannomutase
VVDEAGGVDRVERVGFPAFLGDQEGDAVRAELADRLGADGGCMVTASHNPIDYNGLKLVREGSRPLSADTGLVEIRALAEAGDFPESTRTGSLAQLDHASRYIEHLMGYLDLETLRPMRIVTNAGNGEWGRKMHDDLLDAVPVLRARFAAQRVVPDYTAAFVHGHGLDVIVEDGEERVVRD